jgi:hypothetical protein
MFMLSLCLLISCPIMKIDLFSVKNMLKHLFCVHINVGVLVSKQDHNSLLNE